MNVRASAALLTLAAALGCTAQSEGGVRLSARRPETAASTAAEAPAARGDSVPTREGPWLAEADSVMRVHLARSLYVAPAGFAPGLRECGGDQASDNPPFLVAAARARVIGHDSLSSGNAVEYGDPDVRTKLTTFRVEVTSAAHMQPAWALELPPDSAIPYDEAYAITAAPQVDTFNITLEDVAPLVPRWGVCAPVQAAGAPGYQFWSFTHATDDWVKPVRWTPPTASWDRVRALADSLASTPR